MNTGGNYENEFTDNLSNEKLYKNVHKIEVNFIKKKMENSVLCINMTIEYRELAGRNIFNVKYNNYKQEFVKRTGDRFNGFRD